MMMKPAPPSESDQAMKKWPVLVAAPLLLMLVGCSSNPGPTTRPMTAQERQEAALRDPMNYKIQDDDASYDISGGNISHFDKDAFKRDLDHVLSP
jgi:hypothetical protein